MVLATLLLSPPTAALAQSNHSFVIATSDGLVITDADLVEHRFAEHAEHAMKVRGESLMRLGRLAWSPHTSSGIALQLKVDGAKIPTLPKKVGEKQSVQ